MVISCIFILSVSAEKNLILKNTHNVAESNQRYSDKNGYNGRVFGKNKNYTMSWLKLWELCHTRII